MKKLLLFFLLTAILSCSIFKNKAKQKQDFKTADKVDLTLKSTEKDKGVEINSKSDSTALKTHRTANKSLFTNSQNFNLQNNGKCADPGTTRFVKLMDVTGNTTEIPVNDNTDLKYGNETKLENDISDLKIEIIDLKKQKDSIAKNYENSENTNIQLSKKLESKNLQLDLQTKSSPLSAFIWVGILSIAAWELVKYYIKLKLKP